MCTFWVLSIGIFQAASMYEFSLRLQTSLHYEAIDLDMSTALMETLSEKIHKLYLYSCIGALSGAFYLLIFIAVTESKWIVLQGYSIEQTLADNDSVKRWYGISTAFLFVSCAMWIMYSYCKLKA